MCLRETIKKKRNRGLRAYRKGILAEYLVAFFLRLKGYKILGMRIKTPVGEIDVLTKQKKQLIAFEVKAYKDTLQAAECIERFSKSRTSRALLCYLTQNPQYVSYELRVDAVVLNALWFPRHFKNIAS